jgi:hypothetical protein
MLINEAYKKIRTFCLKALGDDVFNIISANQHAPRPKKPFITIHIGNCKDVSVFNQVVANDGIKTYEMLKTIDVIFNCYTDDHLDAEDYLLTIYNMLATELTFEVFGNGMAYLNTIRNVTDVSTMVSDKIENRALMELKFNIMQTSSFKTGIIEHVEITDKITNTNYNI